MDTDATAKAKEAVGSAKETVAEQADAVREQGRGALRTQVDQRSSQAGQQAQALAETLRQTASQLRESGDDQKARYASLADQGAQRLERAGSYLAAADADELLWKVEGMARRQPLLIAGAGLLLGMAAARFLKASSGERYYQTQRLALPPARTTSWQPAPGTYPDRDVDSPIPAGGRDLGSAALDDPVSPSVGGSG
jgi:hypothetical protein